METGNPSAGAAPQLSTAAIAALQQGNKIEAIKIVRKEHNLGLKEAKDAVDLYVQGQPALQASFAAAQGESKRNALLWLAVIVGLAFLAYKFLIGK
jgi:ribosomal protein L7/L12